MGAALVVFKTDSVVFVSDGFDDSCVAPVVAVCVERLVVSVSVATVGCSGSVVEFCFSIVVLGLNGAPVVDGFCVGVVISFVVVGSAVVVDGTCVVDGGCVVVATGVVERGAENTNVSKFRATTIAAAAATTTTPTTTPTPTPTTPSVSSSQLRSH